MTEKGQVTIPVATRAKHGLGVASRLLFLESRSGAMMLKVIKAAPELTLLEHLTRFKGLEIPERKIHCAPRV